MKLSTIKRVAMLTGMAAVAAAPANATILNPASALSRARDAVANGPRRIAPAISADAAAQRLRYTVTDPAGQPAVYIFGASSGDAGFSVISASDLTPAVLGFSDSGNFDPDNIPVNMQEWLQDYARQVAYAESAGLKPLTRIVARDGDFEPIEPLVKTYWNQSAPYNDHCPMVNSRRSVTGCMATAQAQVLNYHKFPKKATGTVSYSYSYAGSSVKIEYDLDTIPLQWDLMRNNYATEETTAAEQSAVADLMLACGTASTMTYTPVESSANSLNSAQGMHDNMGCTQVGILLGDWLTPDGLNEYVYNYLTDHGPLLYCGQSNSGGHAFVCDGYRGDGYFHFNWGWGGMSDGYFLLNALNPGSQGIGGSASGYNSSQQMLVGLYEPQPKEQWRPVMAADGGSTITDDWNTVLGDTVLMSSPVDKCGYFNYSVDTVTVTYGARLLRNATGVNTYVECYGIKDVNLPGYRGWYSYPFIIPKDLEEGTYSIYPAYKANGRDWEDFLADQNEQTYTLATVRGDSILFSKPTPADIEISDIQFLTPKYAGGAFELTATVTATGDRSFYGNVAMMLGEYLGDDFVSDFQGTSATISATPGNDKSFKYTSTFTNTRLKGTYTLVFIVPETGKIVSKPVDVTITAYPGAAVPTTDNAEILNATSVDPENVRVQADITSTGGYFSSLFYLNVGQYEGDTFVSTKRIASTTYYIEPGQTEQVVFGGAVPAVSGEIYQARLEYYNPATRKYIPFGPEMTFTMGSSAVDTIVTDSGNDTPAEYYTTGGVRAAKEGRTPGLYLRRQGATTTKVVEK